MLTSSQEAQRLAHGCVADLYADAGRYDGLRGVAERAYRGSGLVSNYPAGMRVAAEQHRRGGLEPLAAHELRQELVAGNYATPKPLCAAEDNELTAARRVQRQERAEERRLLARSHRNR